MLPAFCGISGSTRTMRTISAPPSVRTRGADAMAHAFAHERGGAGVLVHPTRDVVVCRPEKPRLERAALSAIHGAVQDVGRPDGERAAIELRFHAVVRLHGES